MNLSQDDSREYIWGLLTAAFESTTAQGTLLDPSGIVEGLAAAYLMVFRAAGWEETENLYEVMEELLEELSQ